MKKQMIMKRQIMKLFGKIAREWSLVVALTAAMAGWGLFAAPVTEDEAKLAAMAWVAKGDLCGAKARGRATEAVRHEVGKSAYYAVQLDEGMVFTSGDTECDPIVAVTSAEEFDDDPRNPLVMLLKRDAEIREQIASDQAARAAAQGTVPGGTPLLTAGAPAASGSSAKWAALLAEGERLETQAKNGGSLLNAAPQQTINDVRVAPILTTKWSQLTHNDSYPVSPWNGKNCYNYYTPAVTFYYYTSQTTISVPGGTMNAYCGCSATALAQLMNRWEYPKSQKSGSYACTVLDIRQRSGGVWEQYGQSRTLSLMTGNYAWSSMVDVPKSSWTEAAAKAIGMLTYNCAVALKSEFSAEGTGASPSQQTLALKNAFGYQNAQYYWSMPGLSNSETLHRRAIYASLDAGAPVLLAIYEYDAASGNVYGGHCVVGDGYGYATVGGSKLPFVHLNMGWSGSDDVWYNLPNVDTAGAGYDNGNYNAFWGVIYNVFPEKTGEVVSGRVLTSGGSPVSGATVTVKRSGNSTVLQTTTSSSSGVYAFILPSGSRYEITATVSGGASGSVTTASVPASGSQIGNSWGNDIVVAQSVDLAVDVAFLSLERGKYDEVRPCDVFAVGQPIISQTYFVNRGAGTATAPIRELHEVLKSGSSTVLRSYVYDSGDDINGGMGSWWTTGLYGDFLQNLSQGSYVYRVTVDPNGTVPDADRSNNTKTFAFKVIEDTPDLVRIEIEGPAELLPGERAAYACSAYYSNGAILELTPNDGVLWSLSANGSHATINPETGVLTAGIDSAPHTVTLRASYTERGVTVSDYLTVSIGAALSLPEALDNTELVFSTDGNAPWFGQTSVHPAGDPDAARSGVINNYESSTMRTTVTGRGTLSFDYLVSSEARYDFFDFTCDTVRKLHESGTNNVWRQYSVTVGEGTHNFVWSYAKDVSNGYGLDAAFVSNVRWTALVTPTAISINQSDLGAIVAGESRQLHATVAMSDGTTLRSVTDEANWSVVADDSATITPCGMLTACPSVEDGDVTVVVAYERNGVRQETSARIVITGRLPAPSAPTIVRATGDADEVILEWTPVAVAQSYVVHRRPASAGSESVVASGLAGTVYHDATVEPGVDYVYSVEAVNTSGRAKSGAVTAHRMVSLVFQGSVGTLPPEGGSASLTVKSNARWTATTESDWITLEVAEGGNGDSLRLTAEANEVHAARSASVTVVAGTGTDHPTTLSFGVAQGPAAIDEPKKCNYAFSLLTDGDSVEPLYATSTAKGSAERIVRAGSSFRVRFGWTNKGEGEGVHDVVNAVRLVNVDGAVASAHTLIESGPITAGAVKATSLQGDDWASLKPGPYALAVTLNAGNTEVETNPDDNEATWRFALRDPLTLPQALGGEGVSFATEDDAWFGSKEIGPDGANGAMTKHLGDGGTNVLRGTVAGAGTLTFDYRVSSESRDRFAFAADGKRLFSEGGAGAWRTKTVTFEDERDHELEWRYEKDATLSERGDCAFLANVTWTPLSDETAPTNVVASKGNGSWIQVTWDPVPGAASYTVARAESEDGPFEVIRRKLTTCSLYDSSVLGGIRYWYRVQAVFPTRVSGWSETGDGYRKQSLSVTGTTRKIPGSAGQSAFDVYGNCRWTAEVVSGSWLKLATESGEERAKVVFSYEKNETGSSREGKIRVTSVNTAGTDTTTVDIKITQAVPADLGTEVSLNAAADCDLRFVLSGDANWVGQTRVSHDGKSSALRSGEVVNGSSSSISTVFTTSGKLTFWWGACCYHSTDFLELYVSGEKVATITGCADGTAPADYRQKNVKWELKTIDIPAGGAVVEWRFSKGTPNSFGEDAAFVDQIVWEPDTPVAEDTDAWWTVYGEELMLHFATTDRDAIMKKPSPGTGGTRGKFKADGSAVLVWEDFVAGTDPFDSDSVFSVTIEMVEGVPVVSWEPKLSAADEAKRHYQMFGRGELKDGEWEPVPDGMEADYNFFRVSVEMR